MRILVISHLFPNACDPIAGIFVLEQVKALRKRGLDVIVLSPIPWAPRFLAFMPRVRKYHCFPRDSELAGVPVHYVSALAFPRGRLFFLYGFFFYLACRRLARKYITDLGIDMIHAHTIMPDGFAAVLLGRKFKVPVICTVHGSDINDYPFASRLTMRATLWALKRVNHLVTVSEKLRAKVRELAGDIATSVAHNGADGDHFTSIPHDDARATLKLPLDKRLVLFVGYLVKAKGLEFLLEAFSLLESSDAILYLVGDGYLKDALAETAYRLGIGNRCFFAGKRPHEEIPLWLSAADCLVLSSIEEGLPTVLTEAMLCRAPIVATDIGGIPEIVHHAKTGLLVPSKDVRTLAAAIDQIVTDRATTEAIKERAAIFARKVLTWDFNAQKMVRLYRSLLEQRTANLRPVLAKQPKMQLH